MESLIMMGIFEDNLSKIEKQLNGHLNEPVLVITEDYGKPRGCAFVRPASYGTDVTFMVGILSGNLKYNPNQAVLPTDKYVKMALGYFDNSSFFDANLTHDWRLVNGDIIIPKKFFEEQPVDPNTSYFPRFNGGLKIYAGDRFYSHFKFRGSDLMEDDKVLSPNFSYIRALELLGVEERIPKEILTERQLRLAKGELIRDYPH